MGEEFPVKHTRNGAFTRIDVGQLFAKENTLGVKSQLKSQLESRLHKHRQAFLCFELTEENTNAR